MARKIRLSLQGFRQIRKGEPGYSETRRRYINEESGEILTKYRYQQLAERLPTKVYEQQLRESVASAREAETLRTHNYTPSEKSHPSFQRNLNQFYTQENERRLEAGEPTLTYSAAMADQKFIQAQELLLAGDRSKGGGVAYALFLLGYLGEEEWMDYDPGET